jgi:hypothetical protein
MVRPADPEGARAAWAALEQTWAATIARADRLIDAQRQQRVDGEWSFVETLRHPGSTGGPTSDPWGRRYPRLPLAAGAVAMVLLAGFLLFGRARRRKPDA